MTVNIQIVGNDAREALLELKNLSFGLLPTVAAPATAPAETTKPLTAAQKKAAEKAAAANISSGEERVGPEDDKGVVEQDAKDEAGDTENTAELNHDSIRGALGDYVKKFGMPAAQEDGPKLIAKALGEKTDKTAWKISEIPDTQEALAKVLAGVHEMTEKNPFKRDAVKAK